MDLHSEKTLAESPVSGVLFISYIEEYFKDKQMIFYPAEMYSGNYTLLMNCSPAQAGNVRRLLDGLVPFLRRSFPSDLDIDLRMGISPVKENPVNFKQLYYQRSMRRNTSSRPRLVRAAVRQLRRWCGLTI